MRWGWGKQRMEGDVGFEDARAVGDGASGGGESKKRVALIGFLVV